MFEIDWGRYIQGDKNSNIYLQYFRFLLPKNENDENMTFQFYEHCGIEVNIWYDFKLAWDLDEGAGFICV